MSQQRIIESEHNDFYKKIIAIRDGKMKKEGLILIEGEDLIDEAKKVGALQYALTYDPKFIVNDVPTTLVKQGLYRNLASYQSLPKVIGVAKFTLSKEPGNKVVYLDGVQDPGNVGTLIRTALAFHYSSVILSKDCASIFNAKTIQSTKGALFKIPVGVMDLEELKNKSYNIYLTTLDGEDEATFGKLKEPFALVLGNEGRGIRTEHLSLGQKLRINMSGIDSLNVAIAGGIFLYRFSR